MEPQSPNPPLSPRAAHGALHTAVALFGLAGLFGKLLPLHPVQIVFGRVCVASVAFVGLWFARPHLRGLAPNRREWVLLVLCAAMLPVHWITFFRSIQVSTVAIGLLSYSTAPVFATLLEPLVFRERFSPRTLVAAAVTVVGVAVMVPRWEIGDAVMQGVGWGVLSGFSFAVIILLVRRLLYRLSSLRVTLLLDVLGTAILLPLLPAVWRTPTAEELWLLLALGVICTALAHILYTASLKRLKAQLVAMAGALEPIYGVAFALMLLGEVPDLRTLAGGAVIVAAVLIGMSLHPRGVTPEAVAAAPVSQPAVQATAPRELGEEAAG